MSVGAESYLTALSGLCGIQVPDVAFRIDDRNKPQPTEAFGVCRHTRPFGLREANRKIRFLYLNTHLMCAPGGSTVLDLKKRVEQVPTDARNIPAVDPALSGGVEGGQNRIGRPIGDRSGILGHCPSIGVRSDAF